MDYFSADPLQIFRDCAAEWFQEISCTVADPPLFGPALRHKKTPKPKLTDAERHNRSRLHRTPYH
jgi:hypothetical protein